MSGAGVPRPEDADWLAWWLRVARDRLIESALLPELTDAEVALGFTPEDARAWQRADVERTRARSHRQE
jgi:hypothetical protein